jgi:hypothetical protein
VASRVVIQIPACRRLQVADSKVLCVHDSRETSDGDSLNSRRSRIKQSDFPRPVVQADWNRAGDRIEIPTPGLVINRNIAGRVYLTDGRQESLSAAPRPANSQESRRLRETVRNLDNEPMNGRDRFIATPILSLPCMSINLMGEFRENAYRFRCNCIV